MAERKDSATCTVDDCDKAARTRGMCNTHYARWYRGNTTEELSAPLRPRAEDGESLYMFVPRARVSKAAFTRIFASAVVNEVSLYHKVREILEEWAEADRAKSKK